MSVKIDPRIKIRIVGDGEIHIVFEYTLEDLSEFARAFLAWHEGKITRAPGVFRLRNKEGIDYLIGELQKARKQLYG